MKFLDSCSVTADVSECGVSEECAYYVRRALEPVERDTGKVSEIVRAFRCCAAEVVVLDVLPYPFVRVQVRRVRREEEQREHPVAVRGVLFQDHGAVNLAVVKDKEDGTAGIGYQGLAEGQEVIRRDSFPLDVEMQLSARAHGRHHTY